MFHTEYFISYEPYLF